VKQSPYLSICFMIFAIIFFSAIEKANAAKYVDGAEVSSIVFKGNSIISTDTLSNMASAYTTLNTEAVYALADDIIAEYEKKGYVWAIACPSSYCSEADYNEEQKILTMEIIEGKLGDISVVRPVYMITQKVLKELSDEGLPKKTLQKLKPFYEKIFTDESAFKSEIFSVVNGVLKQYQIELIYEKSLLWANYIITRSVIHKITKSSSTPGIPDFFAQTLEKNLGTVFIGDDELQKGLEKLFDRRDLKHYGVHIKKYFYPFEIYILTEENIQDFKEKGLTASQIDNLYQIKNKAYLGKNDFKKEVLPIMENDFWEKHQEYIFKKSHFWPTYVIDKKLIELLRNDRNLLGCPNYIGEELKPLRNRHFADPDQFRKTLNKEWSNQYASHFSKEILKSSRIISGYYDDDVVKGYFVPQKNSVLNESVLEKSLHMANQTNKIHTEIWLQHGKEKGFADIQLRTREESPVKFGIDYNNFGSEFISKNRYGFFLDIEEPGMGAIFSFRGVTGDSFMNSLNSLSASIPINNYGSRFSINALSSQYAVGKDLVALNLNGNTNMVGGEFTHRIYSKKSSVVFHLGYQRKYSEQGSSDFKLEDEVNVFNLNVDGDYLDSSRRKWIYSLGGIYGNVVEKKDSSPNRNSYSSDFYRLSANLAVIWMWQVVKNVSSLINITSQYTDSRLLPVEEFVIGGYGNIRGHEPSMYIGDSGFTLSSELMYSYRFSEKPLKSLLIQFAAFADYGGVFISDLQQFEEKDEYLFGFGGGIRFFYNDYFQLKCDVGFPGKKQDNEDDAYLYVLGNINFF